MDLCIKDRRAQDAFPGRVLMRILRWFILGSALAALGAAPAAAQVLRVAAASDLQSALPSIAAEFEKATGHAATLTFGSSGNFLTQIQNGAPFDVFLSADVEYPRQLERDGQAERGSLAIYATGHLVLWTRNDSTIDLARGVAALT